MFELDKIVSGATYVLHHSKELLVNREPERVVHSKANLIIV